MSSMIRGGAARSADARSLTTNPSDSALTAKAFKTVIAYTIADVFALTVEESLWVRHHLIEAFKPLEGTSPVFVPLAVRKELLEGAYSKAFSLSDSSAIEAMPLPEDPEVASVGLEGWTGVFMETLTNCYNMRPMTESMIYGKINGILRELGVGDPANPRASRYLPNIVKARLAG